MRKSIEDVLRDHTDRLMALPGVTGTGLGSCDGVPCIAVFVTDLTEELKEKIPEELDGHPVKIEISGPFVIR
jgi:hypothetical protein